MIPTPFYRPCSPPADARTGKTPPTQVHVAPLQATKLASGIYDAVACVSVLEHTRDYAAGVAEFRRVLKNGGRLLLTFDISLDDTSAYPASGTEEAAGGAGNPFHTGTNRRPSA